MFSARNFNKLPSTAREIERNKICLEAFASFNPFEEKKDGTPRYEAFADIIKVVRSLRVVDATGHQIPRQTADLQKDIVETSKHDTYAELVYNADIPTLDLYVETLQEKLMINLTNLISEPEIKINGPLTAAEIARVKETFAQMLKKA